VGPKAGPGSGGGTEKFPPLPGIEAGRPARSLVTTLTDVPKPCAHVSRSP